jgi:hypothetical protein
MQEEEHMSVIIGKARRKALGRPRYRWNDNINIDLGEIG